MTTSNSHSPEASAEQTAAAFVEQQLTAAQRSLRITRIVSVAVVLVVIGYGVGITTWMHYNVLQPDAAADIATARTVDIVQRGGAAFSDQVVQELPAALASVPDMLIAQMPRYRVQLEDTIEQTLAKYGRELQPDVELFLDQFIKENREHVEAILKAVQDPKMTKHFGDQLEQEFLTYLKTPNDRGESVMHLLDQGKLAMETTEAHLHRLAYSTDLTPEELKQRRVLGSLLKAANIKF
jgi:hypothetical protein